MRIGRKFEEMFPFSLPDLFEPKFWRSNRWKIHQHNTNMFEKKTTNFDDYFHVIVTTLFQSPLKAFNQMK